MLFGYPLEIWIAVVVVVITKLSFNKHLTFLGASVTVMVSLSLGVMLYAPIVSIFGLSAAWEIPVAILISLTAENILKFILEVSADTDLLKRWATFLVTRKDLDKK